MILHAAEHPEQMCQRPGAQPSGGGGFTGLVSLRPSWEKLLGVIHSFCTKYYAIINFRIKKYF